MAIKAANREPCTPPRSTLILTPAFVVYIELGIDPQKITSDTTSKDNPTRARLYITSNTSDVNSVFRAGKTMTGSAVTRLYYDRVTSGRMMSYNVSIAKDTRIYLQGRPDSSVSSCTITGSFGAG